MVEAFPVKWNKEIIVKRMEMSLKKELEKARSNFGADGGGR